MTNIETHNLQQLISNAVHSALQQNGITTNTAEVSTSTSFKADAISKKACNRRLQSIMKIKKASATNTRS